MSNRRNSLADITQEHRPQHAGLWLDKFLEAQNDEKAKHSVITVAAGVPVANVYHRHYERWQHSLRTSGAHLQLAEATGRMVLGTGAESVLETAITLHRTYGVPYIPGSALKGLAAAYARQRLDSETWGPQTQAFQTLFGTTSSAGYITFFDALYVPTSGYNAQPLAPDVITVHHKGYYEGKNEAPADWDSPTIIPFASATGCYLLALSGDPRWTTRAFELLGAALRDMGVGAKTSSGYGRMRFLSETEASSLDKRRLTALAKLPRIFQPAVPSEPTLPLPQHAEPAARLPAIPPAGATPTHQNQQATLIGIVGGVNTQLGEASVLVNNKGIQPRPRFVAGLRGKLSNGVRVRVRQLSDGTWEIFEIVT